MTVETPRVDETPGLLRPAGIAPSVDKTALRRQLAQLPQPQNEYEATLPAGEEMAGKETERETPSDVEEIEREIRGEEEALQREEKARQSAVMKRGLPRGSFLPERFIEASSGVSRMLLEEMDVSLRWEAFRWPAPGVSSRARAMPPVPRGVSGAEAVAILEAAEELGSPREEECWEAWLDAAEGKLWDPSTQEVTIPADEASRLRCVREAARTAGKSVERMAKWVAKEEKRANVLLGGYVAREKSLAEKVRNLHREVDVARMNLLCFGKLEQRERESEKAGEG